MPILCGWGFFFFCETVSLLPHASWLQPVCLITSGSLRLAPMRVLLNWLPRPTMFSRKLSPTLQAGVRRFSDSTVFIVLSLHCASRTQRPYCITAAQGTILGTTRPCEGEIIDLPKERSGTGDKK